MLITARRGRSGSSFTTSLLVGWGRDCLLMWWSRVWCLLAPWVEALHTWSNTAFSVGGGLWLTNSFWVIRLATVAALVPECLALGAPRRECWVFPVSGLSTEVASAWLFAALTEFQLRYRHLRDLLRFNVGSRLSVVGWVLPRCLAWYLDRTFSSTVNLYWHVAAPKALTFCSLSCDILCRRSSCDILCRRSLATVGFSILTTSTCHQMVSPQASILTAFSVPCTLVACR